MTISRRAQLEQRRDHLLARIRALAEQPLLRGSLLVRARRCGRANCACAREVSARHKSLVLSVRLDGKTRMVHVREEDAERVRAAVERCRRVISTLTELTSCEVTELLRGAEDRRRQRRRSRS